MKKSILLACLFVTIAVGSFVPLQVQGTGSDTHFLVSLDAGCTVTAIATDAGCWSHTSGGAGGAGVPSFNNPTRADVNSGSGAVTQDAAITTVSLNMSGYTGTWNTGNFNLDIGITGFALGSYWWQEGTFNAGSSQLTLADPFGFFRRVGTFNADTSRMVFTDNTNVPFDVTWWNMTVADFATVTLGSGVIQYTTRGVLTVDGILDSAANTHFRWMLLRNELNVDNPLVVGPNGEIRNNIANPGGPNDHLFQLTNINAHTPVNIPASSWTNVAIELVGRLPNVTYRITGNLTTNTPGKGAYFWLQSSEGPLQVRPSDGVVVNSSGIQTIGASTFGQGIVAGNSTWNIDTGTTGSTGQALGLGGPTWGICDCPMVPSFYLQFNNSDWTVDGDWSTSGTSHAGTVNASIHFSETTTEQFIGGASPSHNFPDVIVSGGDKRFPDGMSTRDFTLIGGSTTVRIGTGETWTTSSVIQGSDGNLLVLRSTTLGTQWFLDAEVGTVAHFVDVRDSVSTTCIDGDDGTNVNSGNNVNWNFGTFVTSMFGSLALSLLVILIGVGILITLFFVFKPDGMIAIGKTGVGTLATVIVTAIILVIVIGTLLGAISTIGPLGSVGC